MKNIIIGILISVFAFYFVGGGARAERFKMPQMPPVYTDKIIAVDKASGVNLWEAVDTYQVGVENKKPFIRFTQNGSGRYGNSKESIEWKTIGYYYADPYIRPYYSKKEIYSKSGKLLKVETFDYQAADKKIYFTREDKLKNKTARQTFKYADDTIDKNIIGYAILSYPFDKKGDFSFHYISDEPKVYSLTLHYRGKEKITVPAGNYECHKLEMTVDLGVLGIVGAFIPKTYFWFSLGEPIEWVKYEGLESGIGTPYIVMSRAEK